MHALAYLGRLNTRSMSLMFPSLGPAQSVRMRIWGSQVPNLPPTGQLSDHHYISLTRQVLNVESNLATRLGHNPSVITG